MGISSDDQPDQFRSQAKRHASAQKAVPTLATTTAGLPKATTQPTAKDTKPTQAGGLSIDDGRVGSSSPGSGPRHVTTGVGNGDGQLDDGGVFRSDPEKSTNVGVSDAASGTSHPPDAPPLKSEAAGVGDTAIKPAEEDKKTKQPMSIARVKAGCFRFGGHFKRAICHSWVNVLLVAVPAGIAAKAAGLNPSVVFAINAVAIVPLAGLLSHATESVASRLGDTLGALLNVSFGNAVELIIFIIALVKDEIRIVQASLLGSILANLLLILGMAFLLGGLRYREQVYNSTVTQMSACLLSLSVMSLLLPTAFHAAFNDANLLDADEKVLKVSRGTSVVLLLVYGLYLLFQLKSHAYMYESTPQNIIDEESHPGVLHELMNSSSSSDDSSSSDSSSSDTSGSGSVATTTKRMKRMFKHKRRRKSSVSTSSTQTAEQALSPLASPAFQEPKDYTGPGSSQSASRTGSAFANTAHDDADAADREDNGTTRVYDWATRKQHSHDGSKSPERKKRSKKDIKKERKRLREVEKAAREEEEVAREASGEPAEVHGQSRVEFAEEVQVAPSPATPGRLPFNMRQLSRGQSRPILPSILSNNVFVQPAPNATPTSARPGLTRSHSAGSPLRRTSSLPDRLNRQITPASAHDPAPPVQRKARSIRQVNSGLSTTASDGEEEEQMSRTAAVVLLLCSTALVAVCAEFLVDAIPEMLADSDSISEAFIGLIILPIVGNAAEHVTAVTVAAKNKMDLAIGVAVGSSIQIALFVTPVVVLLGWILDTNMSLYFNIFETVSLFVTAFVVNFLVLDGRSNYLEGSLLIAAYVIIAVGAFFYPDSTEQSSFGGGGGGGS